MTIGLMLAVLAPCQAVVTVIWTDTPQGVLATYGGSMDLSRLGTKDVSPTIQPLGSVRNNQSFAYYDGTLMDVYTVAGSVSEPLPDNGGSDGVSGLGSGDAFGFSNQQIWLPAGYVSGSELSGQILFEGLGLETVFQDSALMKLTAGDEVPWRTADGLESVVFSQIPEPNSAWLALSGGVFFYRRRR